MPVSFGCETGVLIDANRKSETAPCGEVCHERCGEWGLLPEAHALREIAAIVRQSHGEAEQVELSVAFGSHFIENCLFAIDFCFDGGLRFFSRHRVADFKHSAEAGRDRAPMLAVVTADPANGSD